MQHITDGEYTTKQIEDFHKNVFTKIEEWKKTVEDMYLPQGQPFLKYLWYHWHIMEKQHKQINDPSLWNNMVSTKIYTDDTLKEKNQQEAQDGEIQSLE